MNDIIIIYICDAIRMEHAEAKCLILPPCRLTFDAIRMEHAEAKAISRYHAATSGEFNPYAARRGKVSPYFNIHLLVQ